MKTEGFKDSQDAEFWHGKAVELAVNFLPSNAPLVKHIVTSYQKHHSPCNDKIPEDKEVNENVEMHKAQVGIISCKYAPVIKQIKETTIKLTPLDIQTNDYLAELFDDKDEPMSDKEAIGKSQSSNQLHDNKDNEYTDNDYSHNDQKNIAAKTSNKFLNKNDK